MELTDFLSVENEAGINNSKHELNPSLFLSGVHSVPIR